MSLWIPFSYSSSPPLFFFLHRKSSSTSLSRVPRVLSPYLNRSLLTWTQHLSNHFLKLVRIGDIKHSKNKRKTHSSLFSFPIVAEIGFLNVQIDILYVRIQYWKGLQFSLLAFRYVVTTDLVAFRLHIFQVTDTIF